MTYDKKKKNFKVAAQSTWYLSIFHIKREYRLNNLHLLSFIYEHSNVHYHFFRAFSSEVSYFR